ncbi:MAG: mercury methylation ferredoxin HgcB [Methanomassiliicoccales archaeon]|nr:mercury methylation ferredoxin HgcB [Methanomassiliicoccales archaeon]
MELTIGLEQRAAVKPINTLVFHPGKCVNCGLCLQVCPHRVFAQGERRVRLARAEDCMECGACQRNCASGAICVESGVGCAAAMIMAALKGNDEVSCGEDCCR